MDEEFPKSGEGNARKQLLRDGSVAVSHTLAQQGTMLTWHGHAAFEVTMPDRQDPLIEPWLNNPVSPLIKTSRIH